MENWPSLDMHSHLEVGIASRELLALRAVVFAATRSLDESRRALDRQPHDLLTVWGAGVHPGVKKSLEGYDSASFAALTARTAYVAEVGLDGRVKSRLPLQQEVLRSVLSVLQSRPRITSLHSYAATNEVVELLEELPIRGTILHWWLGDLPATHRAIELGAYFSLNFANLSHPDVLTQIPLERVLTETDHPDGDRRSPQPRRPGHVAAVEAGLAELHNMTPADIRRACWRNLQRLVEETRTSQLLPQRVQAIVDAA